MTDKEKKAKEDIQEFFKEYGGGDMDLYASIQTVLALFDEVEKLRKFADWVIETSSEGDIDSTDVVDYSIDLGIVELRPIDKEQSIDGEKEHYFTKWTPKG